MKVEAFNYPCPSCGAPQVYSPSLQKLECDFCKTQTAIPTTSHQKHSYNQAVPGIQENTKDTKCKKCGASFEEPSYTIASICPYCKTPTLTNPTNDIPIDGVIPFKITHKKAQQLFKEWVGSLWFAPTAFTKYLDGDNKLNGIYLPHWSFDTQTSTHYSGARGDAYYVYVDKVITDQNGNRRVVQVQERRIRWTPVSGVVYGNFQEISTPASKHIDKAIVDALASWDYQELKGFTHKFLSGFEAQEYTSSIEQGFEDIKQKLAPHIRQKIIIDIGGDAQQIHSITTKYSDIKYQNNLYPVWSASFKWNNKEYDYAINAQTGKVSGERPYSIIKIASAIAGVIAILVALYYIGQIPQVQEFLSNLQSNSQISSYHYNYEYR
jgi:ribosomal protein L37AE/L43A